jgi:hypothetical protein
MTLFASFLNGQVYNTPIPLTHAMQGVIQAKFENVGGAGYIDIVASTYVDKRIVWYNGDGEGTFLAEHEIETDLEDLFLMAFAPLDGVGLNDIVIATVSGDIYIIERTGLDSYLAPALIDEDFGTLSQLELKDLNNDGYPELIAADDIGLLYLPNNPGSGFSNSINIFDDETVKSFDFGDFNNDGYTDITFIDIIGNLRWVPGMSDGSFGPPILLLDGPGTGLRNPDVSDIDSDGDDDIIAAAYQTDDIRFFVNNGSGLFITSELAFGSGVQHAMAIDMDADNDLDLVVADDNSVSIMEHLGAFWGPVEPKGFFEGFFASLDVKDVDNDGRGEILLGALEPNGIQYFENVPFHGVLPGRKISSDALDVVGLQLADIDGDGDKDLVSASREDQKVSWYEKLAPGQFSPQRYITDRAVGTDGFLALDYHGTGVQEVIVERKNLFGQPRLAFIDNDGTGQFAYPDDQFTMGELYAMTAGNMDVGTKEDLVFSTPFSDGRIARVRLNTTNNVFIHVVASGQGEVRSLAIADINGDGYNDVIGSSVNQGLKWYQNFGNGTTYGAPQVIDDMLETYHNMSAYDMDGDADQDIVAVVVDGGDAALYWFENDGLGSFTRHLSGLFCAVDSELNIGDAEGDGDIDMLYSDVNQDLRWAVNVGNMLFSEGPLICQDCVSPSSSSYTAIEDADGDGDLDIYFEYDEIYYAENTGLWCPADIDRNGLVNVNDFIALNSQFGMICNGYCPADINGDGVVGIDDFIMLNSAYGTPCE